MGYKQGDNMKRKDALNLIKVEFAKHGEHTQTSMRAYTESRISFDAYTEAMKDGMKIFVEDE